ncbi:MAG: DUF2787 domain-containing protein [Magnetococcus sp. YQC-5]
MTRPIAEETRTLADQENRVGSRTSAFHHYGAETGGYHPVEVGIDPLGKIHYLTDFAFVAPQGTPSWRSSWIGTSGLGPSSIKATNISSMLQPKIMMRFASSAFQTRPFGIN